MISPDFRINEPTNLKAATMKFVQENHGHELWEALQPSIDELESIRAELSHAAVYKCDVEQLKKLQGLFAKNYCNSMLLNKYFSFGNGPRQINTPFIYRDSFSQDRISSYSPIFDAYSSKFNYGVCLSRIACYMPLEGDGIKYACKNMQMAAWVFHDLSESIS